MAYTDQKEYRKFLQSKCNEHDESDCGCKDDDDKCSCCPTGLVAVYDDKGIHLGCLTPNDAEMYHAANFTCQDGYVKLINNGTNEFLGCVPSNEYADIYAIVNPVITP